MKKPLIISLLALMALSCERIAPELPVPDDDLTTRGMKFASYAGAPPTSGKALSAFVENGIAPISFAKGLQYHCCGAAGDGSREYPDLFFMQAGGIAEGIQCGVSAYSGKSKDGRLIYSAMKEFKAPWEVGDKRVRVMQLDGATVGINMTASALNMAKYTPGSASFGTKYFMSCEVKGMPSAPIDFDLIVEGEGKATLYALMNDGTAKQESMSYVEQGFYDALGRWRGHIGGSTIYRMEVDTKNWTASKAEKVCDENAVNMPNTCCCFNDPANGVRGFLALSKFGPVKFMNLDAPGDMEYVTDGAGNHVIYSGVPHRATMMRVPGSGKMTDFIVSGEGATQLFKFTGKYDEKGVPIYGREEYILCQNAELYGGSLTVPTVVDWDRDGVLDIISGNSEGRIFFYKNYATDASPAFGDPVYLQSCGEEIHFRGGYYEVQGPDDGGAWGYICPNVIDWNGDGIPDILTSSNATRIELMLGTGKDGADCLGPRQTITMDGLEVWGMWRVRPGVAKVGKEIYVVFMDTDDALHLYRKTSNTTLGDCGKLLMSDGKPITGHYDAYAQGASALGYQGREKIEICDWDGDGDWDLLVGGPKQLCMPSPERGLPYNGNQNQIHAVYLENVGSNEAPVFGAPKQILFKNYNTKASMGAHAQSPSYCMLGDTSAGANLLIGCESGKFFFFGRRDIAYYSF